MPPLVYLTAPVIIQKVIKGINGIGNQEVQEVFHVGIQCNWWRNLPNRQLPRSRVLEKLTDRNLDWHQNFYDVSDPLESGNPFKINTPYISTTAGTVERDVANYTTTLTPAWKVALGFATDGWKTDGWLFYCYLFVVGKRAAPIEAFSEEIRELNIYTGFSPYQPEGEITAKIVIPSPQIERAEYWDLAAIKNARNTQTLPAATSTIDNPNFVPPQNYNNLRELLL